MTSSDGPEDHAALLDRGWSRGFVASEPRLSEAVQTYLELGFEVLVRPVPLEEAMCSECLRHDPAAYRLIYIRRPDPAGERPASQAP